jgi:hypothetical protein
MHDLVIQAGIRFPRWGQLRQQRTTLVLSFVI